MLRPLYWGRLLFCRSIGDRLANLVQLQLDPQLFHRWHHQPQHQTLLASPTIASATVDISSHNMFLASATNHSIRHCSHHLPAIASATIASAAITSATGGIRDLLDLMDWSTLAPLPLQLIAHFVHCSMLNRTLAQWSLAFFSWHKCPVLQPSFLPS